MNSQERTQFWNVLCALDGVNLEKDRISLFASIKYPQSLYRFRTITTPSLDALRLNKLFFARADYFDDPFDSFMYVDVFRVIDELKSFFENTPEMERTVNQLSNAFNLSPEIVLQQFHSLDPLQASIAVYSHLQNIRDQIQKEFHIACFSQNGLNETLWLKYADNHRGFVLEYDLLDDGAYLCGKQEECVNCFAKDYHPSIYPVVYSNVKYDATMFARAVATYNLSSLSDDETRSKIITELGPQHWEREKIALLKKKCHEHDEEWRAVLSSAPSSRPYVKWKPSSITLGLRCKGAERNMVIETAKLAGIDNIYECYINITNDLDRRPITSLAGR